MRFDISLPPSFRRCGAFLCDATRRTVEVLHNMGGNVVKQTWLALLVLIALSLHIGSIGAVPVAAQPIVDQKMDSSTERMVVIVTAGRIPQVLEDVPVSVEVIDKEDIERSGANT